MKTVSLEERKYNTMNKENMSLRNPLSVLSDVENATCVLSSLSTALQLLVDRYHLDKNNLSEMETYDYLAGRHDINDIIYLVSSKLYDVLKEIEDIRAFTLDEDADKCQQEGR